MMRWSLFINLFICTIFAADVTLSIENFTDDGAGNVTFDVMLENTETIGFAGQLHIISGNGVYDAGICGADETAKNEEACCMAGGSEWSIFTSECDGNNTWTDGELFDDLGADNLSNVDEPGYIPDNTDNNTDCFHCEPNEALDKETCISTYSLNDWKDFPYGTSTISGRGICMGYDELDSFTKLKGECDLCETDDNICNAFDSQELCESSLGNWTAYNTREICEERGICSDGSVTHNNGSCGEADDAECQVYNDDKDACSEYCPGAWIQAQCENRTNSSGEIQAADSELGDCSNSTYDNLYCECLHGGNSWSSTLDNDFHELEWIPENSWVPVTTVDICEDNGYVWQIEEFDPSLDNYIHNPTCYDHPGPSGDEGYCKVDGAEFEGYCPDIAGGSNLGDDLPEECCWSEGSGQGWIDCSDSYTTCTAAVSSMGCGGIWHWLSDNKNGIEFVSDGSSEFADAPDDYPLSEGCGTEVECRGECIDRGYRWDGWNDVSKATQNNDIYDFGEAFIDTEPTLQIGTVSAGPGIGWGFTENNGMIVGFGFSIISPNLEPAILFSVGATYDPTDIIGQNRLLYSQKYGCDDNGTNCLTDLKFSDPSGSELSSEFLAEKWTVGTSSIVDVDLTDLNDSCGDGLCYIIFGENPENCPEDCTSYCGDLVCDANETYPNCPTDCEASCGDGICSRNEYVDYGCEADCGIVCDDEYCSDTESDSCEETDNVLEDDYDEDCFSYCGDAYCDDDEHYGNCYTDCSASEEDCGDLYCSEEEGDGDGNGDCPDDCGCGDGWCDVISENYGNCSDDCPSECGDGYCDALLESYGNCPIGQIDYFCDDACSFAGNDSQEECETNLGDWNINNLTDGTNQEGCCEFDDGTWNDDDGICTFPADVSSSWQLGDCPTYCGDGFCDIEGVEHYGNCPIGTCSDFSYSNETDCLAAAGETWGDGFCSDRRFSVEALCSTYGFDWNSAGDCTPDQGDGHCDQFCSNSVFTDVVSETCLIAGWCTYSEYSEGETCTDNGGEWTPSDFIIFETYQDPGSCDLEYSEEETCTTNSGVWTPSDCAENFNVCGDGECNRGGTCVDGSLTVEDECESSGFIWTFYETIGSCSTDCPAAIGDGICSDGEDFDNAQVDDCTCGNGFCDDFLNGSLDIEEDINNCPIDCMPDCAGVLAGVAAWDDCTIPVCSGGTTNLVANASCTDCSGVINGEAYIDGCAECVGGNTEDEACATDCNNVENGTDWTDSCGACVPVGDTSCVQGCDGLWANDGSQLVFSGCGVCGGNNSECFHITCGIDYGEDGNGNSCDPEAGETYANCPGDCFCGNSACETDAPLNETNLNCPADCNITNGSCETYEAAICVEEDSGCVEAPDDCCACGDGYESANFNECKIDLDDGEDYGLCGAGYCYEDCDICGDNECQAGYENSINCSNDCFECGDKAEAIDAATVSGTSIEDAFLVYCNEKFSEDDDTSDNYCYEDCYSCGDGSCQEGEDEFSCNEDCNDEAMANELSVPQIYMLNDNYPNPFNPVTLIEYSVEKAGNVNISIYNILGHKVFDLVSGYHSPGIRYNAEWNSNTQTNISISTGIYFYEMRSGDYIERKKMVLVK